MADKISELTALTTPASGDLVAIVDVSDTTQAASGTTKYVTWGDFFNSPTIGTSVIFDGVTMTGVADSGDIIATLVSTDTIFEDNFAYLDLDGTIRTGDVDDAATWPEKTALSGSEEVYLQAEQAFTTVQGIADFTNTQQTITEPIILHVAKTPSASFSMALGDACATIDVTGSGAVTITLTPGLNWEVGYWAVGTNQNTAALTIQASGDAKINGVTNGSVTIPASTTGYYPHFSIRRGPSDNFIVNGTAS